MKRSSINAFPPMMLWIVLKDGWKGVMTIENSPLRHLPPQVAMMVFLILAFMWSGIFAALISNPYAFGWSAVGHVLVISGIFITKIVFDEAAKAPPHSKGSPFTPYNGRGLGGEHE